MSRIGDPFVGLFVAIATLNAAMLIPLFLLLRDDTADTRGPSPNAWRKPAYAAVRTAHWIQT